MPKHHLPEFYTNDPPPPHFVDSLFQSDVRGELSARIQEAAASHKKRAWLIEKDELETIISCWECGWWSAFKADPGVMAGVRPMTHPLDNALMEFLQRYVNAAALTMHVPKLTDVGVKGTSPIYQLDGYEAHALHGEQRPSVRRFLKLLAAGAHFVVIHASGDLGDVAAPAPFFDEFPLPTKLATFHSHYRSMLSPANLKAAKLYPTIVEGEETPESCPFILALLIGRTSQGVMGSNYNSFLQLEGWPASGLHSARHMADYQAHQQSKWNISTYGACPYSEKRGATIFLAPPSWTPAPAPATIMAPYRGASKRQGWLETDLIRLP